MSITINDARWANPERTRAVVTTAERGAVLVKPERSIEWTAFEAWVAAGNTPLAFAPPAEAPADASFRKLQSVLEGVPASDVPSDGALALRLVIEVAKELYARGAPTDSSARFRALMARIDLAEKG